MKCVERGAFCFTGVVRPRNIQPVSFAGFVASAASVGLGTLQAAVNMENQMGRGTRQEQLSHLYQRQHGRCFVCGELAVMDGNGGSKGSPMSAVRFRVGSSYGTPGRVRPRVMTHRKCADERSMQIQDSVDVDLRRARAGRWPTEFYSIPD